MGDKPQLLQWEEMDSKVERRYWEECPSQPLEGASAWVLLQMWYRPLETYYAMGTSRAVNYVNSTVEPGLPLRPNWTPYLQMAWWSRLQWHKQWNRLQWRKRWSRPQMAWWSSRPQWREQWSKSSRLQWHKRWSSRLQWRRQRSRSIEE